MEQHSFRSLDSQPLEELRVPERKLDHLTDLLNRVSETSDIIVGHLGHVALVGGRLVGYLDLGGVADHHRFAGRRERCDDQVDLVAHDVEGDGVAFGDRPSVQDLFEVLLSSLEPELLSGGECDLLRVLGGDLLHRHPLVEGDSRVATRGAVHPDYTEIGVLGGSPEDLRDGLLAAVYLDDVADSDREHIHQGGVESHDPPAGLARFQLGDLYRFVRCHVSHLR